MRYRLRYLHHDLELVEGEFVVGRSASCQLSLDDALVSRRHAMFVVTKDGVTVEDLQSRNGVLVNGKKIASKVAVLPGDKVVIGAQELVLQQAREGRDPAVGRVTANFRRTLGAGEASDTSPSVTKGDSDAELSMVRRVDAFNLLAGVAEKALAMGRAEEAERLLSTPLGDVLEASRGGRRLSPALVDLAARFAAKLATATTKGSWADCVIELYQAQARPCPAQVIDELYSALRKVNAVDLAKLRAYVAVLREKQSTFGPAERFLLQRIEGLERLGALR
jgi:FHA domain